MKATHFGAGNIGRGFIGQVLADNDYAIDFVDINDDLIEPLKEKQEYDIGLAHEGGQEIHVDNVYGINNQKNPEAVAQSIADADIVTTAIGPNILPHIAPLIAQGIKQRASEKNHEPMDVIACENMIGGSSALKAEVLKNLDDSDIKYLDKYIGFPNAAVDRIVPLQSHEDPLYVSVEPFSEWTVEIDDLKGSDKKLTGVHYVEDLEPYIERKLFSVNTGHATVAYLGAQKSYKTIDEALKDPEIKKQLMEVLGQTGDLLVTRWGFDPKDHQKYLDTIVERFENPYISDDISRVARTPIRKLGRQERFIQPLVEAKNAGLPYDKLVDMVGVILNYDDPADEQSVELVEKFKNNSPSEVIRDITGIDDPELLSELVDAYSKHKNS